MPWILLASAFGKSFENAIKSLNQKQRIDIGIALAKGSFDISYLEDGNIHTKIEKGETTLLYFFFNLLLRLQKLGTCLQLIMQVLKN